MASSLRLLMMIVVIIIRVKRFFSTIKFASLLLNNGQHMIKHAVFGVWPWLLNFWNLNFIDINIVVRKGSFLVMFIGWLFKIDMIWGLLFVIQMVIILWKLIWKRMVRAVIIFIVFLEGELWVVFVDLIILKRIKTVRGRKLIILRCHINKDTVRLIILLEIKVSLKIKLSILCRMVQFRYF